MFGYVVINRERLGEEELNRYQSYYCGLCRTLKKQYGNMGRLTLNYDMTFMVLLLADLHDPETREHRGRCAMHPTKERVMAENEVLNYGAAMNILLAYYNMVDDWKDEQKRTARMAAARLKKFIPAIEAQYPRQVRAVVQGMEALGRVEAVPPTDLDAAANVFGQLLGQLFVYKQDRWAEDCRKFGEALGRFIYWLDAYTDLQKDLKKGSYNPMVLLCEREDFRQKTEEMLKGALGECALILERLPLVEHLEILRNVIYSGIWSKFEGEKK